MALEHAGKSIIEMMWEQLDVQYATLMERREDEEYTTAEDLGSALTDGMSSDDAERTAEEVASYFELKGKVAGLAYAIAKLRNPVKPDLDAIRAECAERYDG